MACLGSFCALPVRTSNLRECAILRIVLLLIVLHRMSFVHKCFEWHSALRPWIKGSICLWRICHVASVGDVLETRETRRLIELFQRSVGHMYGMCSSERSFECPGGL